jgi:predicted nucleic acid-binding protein
MRASPCSAGDRASCGRDGYSLVFTAVGVIFHLPSDKPRASDRRPRRWAKLLAELRKSGESMPIKDSLIAATALVHDFIVVTRNTYDFRKAHVKVLDPFA